MHTLEHETSPLGQLAPAVTPLHAPEAPQNAVSVSGSMHVPPQFTCPDGHDTSQAPLTHT